MILQKKSCTTKIMIRIAKTVNRNPLKGFPDTQENAATEITGRQIINAKVLFDGCQKKIIVANNK